MRDPGQSTNGTSGGDHFWRMLLSTAWGLEVVTKMGSDLYISIDVQHDGGGHRDPKVWSALWEGPSTDLARGSVVDAFRDFADRESDPRSGYLSGDEIRRMQEHPECPWRLDEPYWVRCLDGQEFVDIVRERRWKTLQDGDFADKQCGPELRGFAAMVAALLADGVHVRVWCWHSQ